MSKILTNKLESKTGGLTLDPGVGQQVDVLGNIVATTFIGDGSQLSGVSSGGAGLTVNDRININKQVLKNGYLQGIANQLTTGAFGSQSGNLQGVIDYDSSYIGVSSDIFTDATNVQNTSNLTVNPQSPKDGFGSVQITQSLLPYGTEIGESTLLTQPFWSISNMNYYDQNQTPILTYVYNADGTRLYAFVPESGGGDYPSALIEFTTGTPYDVSAIQAFQVHAESLHFGGDSDWGDIGAFAMVNHQNDGFFEVQAVRQFSETIYQRWTIDEFGPGTGVQQKEVLRFTMNEFNPLDQERVHLTFNSDGGKAVVFSYRDDPGAQYEVISFNVSTPFSSASVDYNETGRQSFSAVHNDFSQKHLALKLKSDGSGLLAYMMSDGEGFYAFEVSLANFIADSSTSVVSQSFKASNDNYLTFPTQSIGYDGLLFISGNNRNRFRYEFDPYNQLSVTGLGDIQTPGSFQRSIDLTNDLDAPPTSVVLTQQDNSSDANVTISVDISDGTNTVTITQLDTEVDCSTLTSQVLTATWNLSVTDIQGTNAKIENYSLNFR